MSFMASLVLPSMMARCRGNSSDFWAGFALHDNNTVFMGLHNQQDFNKKKAFIHWQVPLGLFALRIPRIASLEGSVMLSIRV